MIEIEKDIPIPIGGGGRKYPTLNLDIGDSFIVAASDAASARQSAYHATRSTGRKFVTRTVAHGVRIWRTA